MSASYENNPGTPVTIAALHSALPEPWTDGIAIIGMSARFPQSRSVREYWQHLINGDLLIDDLKEEELRLDGVKDATLSNSGYVRRGNAIESADSFDASFFGLSRREAEILDPQHRVFLECAWEALENAGRTGEGEPVGVFAGAGINTYVLQLLGNSEVVRSVGDYQLMLGNDKDFLATRAAYKLNLRGPSVTVQTACSTSLAAVHIACRSLLSRECSMALAGGVSISFPQAVGYSYIPGMILSPDGYCRPFDVNAGGTVPGRGAGVVVLKRLSEAISDGDSIVAVIRGSAWNNDGAGKVGYTAPSIEGQAEVIRAAHASARIDPGRVGYVETHGTATELGDAIEFAALSQVFEATARERRLILGAVKANMGHADAAAGIAGLIKAALAVQSGLIPPTPTFTRPNPVLGIEKTSFEMSSSTIDWTGDPDRWAGVSSFGIGGTNVHVVLSGAPPTPQADAVPLKPRIYPVSAKSATALNVACEQLSKELAGNDCSSAADVTTTLQLGRRNFGFRRAVIADSCLQAAALLEKQNGKHLPEANLERDAVFMFSGQGQQFPGMTAGLYGEDRDFRYLIDCGCDLVKEYVGLDLLPFLLCGDQTAAQTDRIRDTEVAQPLLFLVEYALAHRLRSLGIEPASLLGHSLGELSAASVAGVFSFEDGLRLAVERGRLMAQTPPGLMLAVMLPPGNLNRFLDGGLWLAAENGPKMSVASGLVDAIEELERKLAVEKVASVRLASKNAFHTPLMADAAKAFRTAVAAVTRHAPKIPWLSNVSGTWIGPAEAQDPQYWANQILSPVRFTSCLTALTGRAALLMELGPGEALLGIARQKLPTSIRVPLLGAENRRLSDTQIFLEGIATAWDCGASIRWERLDTEGKGRRVPLPTYPFERQRYWIEKAPEVTTAATLPTPSPSHPSPVPANRSDVSSWFYIPSWQGTPPASLVLPQHTKTRECWLALAGGDFLSDALISALRKQGDTVISVKAGEGFEWEHQDAVVNPSSVAELGMLWERIGNSGLEPGGLLCLPGFRNRTGSEYDAILHILQTAGQWRRHLRRFEFITTGLESVYGEPVVDPERGDLSGLAHVIPLEFDGSECRSIDVEALEADSARSVEQLLEELSTRGAGLAVAYRRSTRWQKGWAQAPLKQRCDSPFRNGGVYLITGGTGGIGYVLARHLLSQYDAHVVIVGRSTLTDRSEWESWIATHGEEDLTSRRIRRITDLETAGGEILYLPGDVSDTDAMRRAFEQTENRFGPLNGVIHAAGVAGGSRILFQSAEEAEKIRSPKIQGSRVIAELLRDRSIDFLLFCSSISSYFSAPTASAYASANAFQNSFAEYCRSVLNIPAVAIAFDAWREVGMMADAGIPEGLESYVDKKMSVAMTNVEGIEVIYRVLAQWRGAQVLATTDLDALAMSIRPHEVASRQDFDEQSRGIESTEQEAIIEIWKDLLGVESVDPSDNFFTLGGHSLMGTMMIARIREQLGITFSMRDVFEAQTPERLAELIRLRGEITSSTELHSTLLDNQERESFEI